MALVRAALDLRDVMFSAGHRCDFSLGPLAEKKNVYDPSLFRADESTVWRERLWDEFKEKEPRGWAGLSSVSKCSLGRAPLKAYTKFIAHHAADHLIQLAPAILQHAQYRTGDEQATAEAVARINALLPSRKEEDHPSAP